MGGNPFSYSDWVYLGVTFVYCLYMYFFSILNNVTFTSYADDNTPYVVRDGVIQVIESLKETSNELFCWFANNQLKANRDRCDLITSSINEVSICVENCPAGIYLFKVNNRNTRTRCEICSKLTINTPERRQWRRSGVFIVNFEHISHLVLVFLLLTLSR